MVSMKNVTTEPVFTIEKQCDRCRNVLYFSDTVISDIETDDTGKVVHSSIVCPICGNVIVLYSIKESPHEDTILKVAGVGDEA
jgi:ribosomal protein S27AE